MNILAFDSSSEILSIALSLDNGDLMTFTGEGGPNASALILPSIQALLKDANKQLADLDGIAFGAGPGAFTGVRVACGVAQGLGFGANLPVVGVNTLHALAQTYVVENAPLVENGPIKVLACMDARMGEMYFAALERTNTPNNGCLWHEIVETMVVKPDNMPEITGENWVGVGNAWHIFSAQLQQKYLKNIVTMYPQYSPNAQAITQLAAPMFVAGLAKPASEAMPIYIRNRVALTTIERAEGQRL
jgi:tRNA threonylcarbamoyladenosine biosynthesis protein TsaB